MKIRNQKWEMTAKYLVLRLNEPYCSAWQRFGWDEGTEGYSVSKEALNIAKSYKKKILVRNNYGDYEITATKASRYLNCEFTARDNKPLICIPKTAFKRLPDEYKDAEPVNAMGAFANMPEEMKANLRKKLGLPVRSANEQRS